MSEDHNSSNTTSNARAHPGTVLRAILNEAQAEGLGRSGTTQSHPLRPSSAAATVAAAAGAVGTTAIVVGGVYGIVEAAKKL